MADSNTNKPQPSPTPELSRRDFLRRAGKEAAVTGTKLVPGAAIAQKVLGMAVADESKPGTADTTDAPKGFAERLAAWRRRRQSSGKDDQA